MLDCDLVCTQLEICLAEHVGHRDAMRHVVTRTSAMKMNLKSRNPLLCNYLVEAPMHKLFLVSCLLAHIPDPKS